MPINAGEFKHRLSELLEIPVSSKDGVDADDVLWAIEEVALEAVQNADELVFPGIGKLICKVSEARKGRNPATGESLQIPAKVAVRFSVSKTIKDEAPSIKKGRAIIEKREAARKRKRKGTTGLKKRGRPKGKSKKASRY